MQNIKRHFFFFSKISLCTTVVRVRASETDADFAVTLREREGRYLYREINNETAPTGVSGRHSDHAHTHTHYIGFMFSLYSVYTFRSNRGQAHARSIQVL